MLTLSHWPQSGTPQLAAQGRYLRWVVFNYLDNSAWHRDVPAVTSSHFDEDGLIGPTA
jgi:hypothetical protein